MTESDKKIMKEENCNCCYFYAEGECRHHAPVTGMMGTVWPDVSSKKWCGDWAKARGWIYE